MVISLLYQDCASTFLVALAIAFLSHQHLCLDAQKTQCQMGAVEFSEMAYQPKMPVTGEPI